MNRRKPSYGGFVMGISRASEDEPTGRIKTHMGAEYFPRERG